VWISNQKKADETIPPSQIKKKTRTIVARDHGEWPTGQPRLQRTPIAAGVWNEKADVDLTGVCFACPANAYNNTRTF